MCLALFCFSSISMTLSIFCHLMLILRSLLMISNFFLMNHHHSFLDLNLLSARARFSVLSINCFFGPRFGNFQYQFLNVLYFLYLITNFYVLASILSVIIIYLKSLTALTSVLSLIVSFPSLIIFSLLPRKSLGSPLSSLDVFFLVMLLT